MNPALRLLAADDEAVVVDDVDVDGVVGEGVDGRDELGRSSGTDGVSGGRECELQPDQKFGRKIRFGSGRFGRL